MGTSTRQDPQSFACSYPQCCLEAQSRKHTGEETVTAGDGSGATPVVQTSAWTKKEADLKGLLMHGSQVSVNRREQR